jgi:hypothetical protein
MSYWADYHYLPYKSARGKTIELNARILPGGRQFDIFLIHRHVHQSLRVIDDVGKRLPELELMANKILKVGRRDHAVDW